MPGRRRSKRDAILTAAAVHFGRVGYEDTKWAEIAADVGVGSTALYHYFESKLHCLFEIMSDTLLTFRVLFDDTTRAHDDFAQALRAVIQANFLLDDADVARCRVLVAEQGRLGQPRTSEREEEARRRALAMTRDLELAWSNFLSRGMATGVVPEADVRLLTRALLGLHNSVWHWYRPHGTLTLADVDAFYVPLLLAVAGLEDLAPPPHT